MDPFRAAVNRKTASLFGRCRTWSGWWGRKRKPLPGGLLDPVGAVPAPGGEAREEGLVIGLLL